MKKLQCVLYISYIFSLNAFATGGGVSGGGNVVVCKNPEIQATQSQQSQQSHPTEQTQNANQTQLALRSKQAPKKQQLEQLEKEQTTYQLLDYYDATQPQGYKFSLDLGPGKTYKEKIDYVLNRLAQVDKYRASVYKKMADNFEKEAEFSDKPGTSTDSLDLGSGYILPPNCSIERVVILRSEDEKFLHDSDKNYEISMAWKDFNEETKAGMVLHEISYREAISRGAINSLAIRRFVGLISSKNLLTADYTVEILKSGLEYWGENSFPFFIPQSYGHDYETLAKWIRINDFMGSADPKALERRDGGEKFHLRFSNQNLSCTYLIIKAGNRDKQKLLKMYKKISSAKEGIFIHNIDEQGDSVEFNCGTIYLNNSMFKKTNHSFNLFIDTDSHFELSTWGFGINSSAFYNQAVEKGTIDGKDVSGQICTLSSSDEIECHFPKKYGK